MSSSKPQRRRQLPSAWDKHHRRIVEMYREDSMPLAEIVQTLKQQHGFLTTETALKMKLCRWKVGRQSSAAKPDNKNHVSYTASLDPLRPPHEEASIGLVSNWEPTQTEPFSEPSMPDVQPQDKVQESTSESVPMSVRDQHDISKIWQPASQTINPAPPNFRSSLALEGPWSLPSASQDTDSNGHPALLNGHTPDHNEPPQPLATALASRPSTYAMAPELRQVQQDIEDNALACIDSVGLGLANTEEPSSRLSSLQRILASSIFLNGGLTEPLFQQAREYCSLAMKHDRTLEDAAIGVPYVFTQTLKLREEHESLSYTNEIEVFDDIETVASLYAQSLISSEKSQDLALSICDSYHTEDTEDILEPGERVLELRLEACRRWLHRSGELDEWPEGTHKSDRTMAGFFAMFFEDVFENFLWDLCLDSWGPCLHEFILSCCKQLNETPWPPWLDVKVPLPDMQLLLGADLTGSQSSHFFFLHFKLMNNPELDVDNEVSIYVLHLFLEKAVSDQRTRSEPGMSPQHYYEWCSAFTHLLGRVSCTNRFEKTLQPLHRAWMAIPHLTFKGTSQDSLRRLASRCAIRDIEDLSEEKAEILLKVARLIDTTSPSSTSLGLWDLDVLKQKEISSLLKEAWEASIKEAPDSEEEQSTDSEEDQSTASSV